MFDLISAMRHTSSATAIFALLTVTSQINAQGDSLRSALRAMSQRQKELGGYDNLYYYNDDSNDVPLLRDYLDRYGHTTNGEHSEKLNYDYDEEPEIEKRISSAFRERMADEDRQSRLEEIAKAVLSNLEKNEVPENYDDEYLDKLYGRYTNEALEYPNKYRSERTNKRVYYPINGVENIGLRKRGKYVGNDDEPLYNYNQRIPREEEDNEFPEYPKSHYYQRPNANYHQHHYKRFLVAKRSSNNYKSTEHKRSVKKQTDPRVEKELSNIFGGANLPNFKQNKVTAVKPLPTQPLTTRLPAVDLKKNLANIPPNLNKTKFTKNALNKEVLLPIASAHDRPVRTAKKSINWSDYLGIDKRKTAENNGLDKDWLMGRFHKAVAITAKKRNVDLPLKYFRSHDDISDKSEDKYLYPIKNPLKEGQIDEYSSTLRNMDEKMVDDALKYTGAHQDETDPAEIQKVKDNIINNLAAAYNIEKMRNALEEYKNSVEIEKAKLKQEEKLPSDDYNYEEKRNSVPHKEPDDESRETIDGDNNIKCTTSEECHEQSYNKPTDILDSHFNNNDQCPAIQKACSNVASIVGHYGHVFQGACNIYQMCLLCSMNSWFSPTRHCNLLFLDKAYEMCLGKDECHKEAQKSIGYMLDISKSLQAHAAIAEQCEVTCPDNYVRYDSK